MGHAHFLNNEVRIPWVPTRPNVVFFGCKMPEKSAGKLALKSVNGCYAGFSNQERNLPSRQNLPVHKCNKGFV